VVAAIGEGIPAPPAKPVPADAPAALALAALALAALAAWRLRRRAATRGHDRVDR